MGFLHRRQPTPEGDAVARRRLAGDGEIGFVDLEIRKQGDGAGNVEDNGPAACGRLDAVAQTARTGIIQVDDVINVAAAAADGQAARAFRAGERRQAVGGDHHHQETVARAEGREGVGDDRGDDSVGGGIGEGWRQGNDAVAINGGPNRRIDQRINQHRARVGVRGGIGHRNRCPAEDGQVGQERQYRRRGRSIRKLGHQHGVSHQTARRVGNRQIPPATGQWHRRGIGPDEDETVRAKTGTGAVIEVSQ